MKGFVIGATGSGTGKTTITLAILAYLSRNGYQVAPFKVGPDFIDPGHHEQVSGFTSYNLDSWMLSREYNQALFYRNTRQADIAVVEGVMGLFDGYDGCSEAGSTAQMAKWLNLPVVLVVSAKGKARSAAAIVKGFETFDPDVNIAGVIFSQTGSPRHYDYLKRAVEQNCRTKCLGCMPRNEAVVLPERHLGLVTAREMAISPQMKDVMSTLVEDHLDIPGLIQCLSPLDPVRVDLLEPTGPAAAAPAALPVIAVAKDPAFCFYYPDNLALLKQFGATIVEFSPLADDQLPEGIDGIYLGGGYPEVFARQLSENTGLLSQIKTCSTMGMPIYGECGGFMVLCRDLFTMDDAQPFSMAGCFDFQVSMSRGLRSLGYREVTLIQDTIIGRKGTMIRGHEFHYSALKDPSDPEPGVYQTASRAGQTITLKGYQVNNTLGSYLHVHFGSNPDCARQLVAACRAFKEQKQIHGIPNT